MSGVRVTLVVLMGLILMVDGYVVAARQDSSGSSGMSLLQKGVASWYGSEEQGKLTANGERFNRHELTAASRRIPFNMVVHVTNTSNGRSVDVRINDRGPYKKGRILDLSEAAADTLDMKTTGTAPVKIEVASPSSVPAVTTP